MIESYHIINRGITNVVDKEMFYKVYKPAGWKLDPKFHAVEVNKIVKIAEATLKEPVLKEVAKAERKKGGKSEFSTITEDK